MKYKVGMSDSQMKRSSSRSGSSKRNRVPHSRSSSSTRRSSNSGGMFFSASKLGASSGTRSRNSYRKQKRLSRGFSLFGGDNRKGRPDTQKAKGKQKTFKQKAFIFVKRAFFFVTGLSLITGVSGAIVLGIYLKSLDNSLPDPNQLVEWRSDESTIIYSRDGQELFKVYGDENREFVSIEDVPDETKWALLAAEDIDFYEHNGLDWTGIIRCALISVRAVASEDGNVCGASTITQQLVRNTVMYEVYGDEAFERSTLWKSVRRKLREILLSMKVEQTLTKDEILQLYMNEVPLGGVNYGYGAAAQSYYNKDVSELTLEESAILAGVISSPSVYSPVFGTNPELAERQQEYVFGQLEEYEDVTGISAETVQAAREAEVVYESPDVDIAAYHWVFYIKQQLEEEYGVEVVQKGGLRVTTSIDMEVQRIAEEELRNGIRRLGEPYGVKNASLVAIDPRTGEIIAMVGSLDVNSTDPRIDGKVNIATSNRQMGSSFKPYVYLTAYERWGPWMATPDIAYNFGGYKPTNWDNRYYGPMVAREALVTSRNLPANYALQTVGIDPVISNVEKMGVTTLTDRGNYGLSLALGAAEMKLVEHVGAFTVFSTGGVKRDLISVTKVTDSSGDVLYEFKGQESNPGERIFSEEDIYLLNYTLCDLGGFGDQPFSQYYSINGRRGACGKTGTTNGPKDLVSMQYNKNITVGIWAGNNNGKEVPGAWSTTVPLPIMNSFMNRISGKYAPELPSDRPSGIASTTVCEDTGRIPQEGSPCKRVSTVYVRGRGPQVDSRSQIKVCTENNKIASNQEQAENFDLLKTVSLLELELENSAQNKSYTDYLTKLSNGGKYSSYNKHPYIFSEPDTAQCELPLGPGNSPVVSFNSPSSGTTVDSGDVFTVSVDARAENSIQNITLNWSWNSGGTTSTVLTTAPYEHQLTAPNIAGNYTVTATVRDSEGRTSSKTISIVVNSNAPQPSITITSPGSGATVGSFPLSLQATLANGDASITNIRFWIQGPGGFFFSTNAVNSSGNTWTASWDGKDNSDVDAAPGTYTVTAIVDLPSGADPQDSITINVQ